MTLESQGTIISQEAVRSVSRLTWVQRRRRGRVRDGGGGAQERTRSALSLGSKDARLTALNSVQRRHPRTAKKGLCGPKPGPVPVSNILLHRLVIPTLSLLPTPRRPSLRERLLPLPHPAPPLLPAGTANPGLSNHLWLLITQWNHRGSSLRTGRDSQRNPSR